MIYFVWYVFKGLNILFLGMEFNWVLVFICLELIGGLKINFFFVILYFVFDKCEIFRVFECVK